MFKHIPRLDIRKYSFSHRVVDTWNSLPECVISAKTVFTFEVRLDKYWHSQDIIYNYESVIATGQKKNLELKIEADEDGLLSEEDLW